MKLINYNLQKYLSNLALIHLTVKVKELNLLPGDGYYPFYADYDENEKLIKSLTINFY
jgi:hypothetical protein